MEHFETVILETLCGCQQQIVIPIDRMDWLVPICDPDSEKAMYREFIRSGRRLDNKPVFIERYRREI